MLREPGGGAAFPLSVLGCEYPVDMPKELGGAGAGFAGASAGFGGASDGRMKVAMMLSRHHDASGAHKLQQDPLGPKGRKDSELARTKEGFLIYSALGTESIEVREYTGTAGLSEANEGELPEFLGDRPGIPTGALPKMEVKALRRTFDELCEGLWSWQAWQNKRASAGRNGDRGRKTVWAFRENEWSRGETYSGADSDGC